APYRDTQGTRLPTFGRAVATATPTSPRASRATTEKVWRSIRGGKVLARLTTTYARRKWARRTLAHDLTALGSRCRLHPRRLRAHPRGGPGAEGGSGDHPGRQRDGHPRHAAGPAEVQGRRPPPGQ